MHRNKRPREECGVFGIFGHPEAANLTYLGLPGLGHGTIDDTLAETVRQAVPLTPNSWTIKYDPTVPSVVLGAMFLAGTFALERNPTAATSMRLFGFSITYVTALFGAMTLDVLVQYGW